MSGMRRPCCSLEVNGSVLMTMWMARTCWLLRLGAKATKKRVAYDAPRRPTVECDGSVCRCRVPAGGNDQFAVPAAIAADDR